MFHQKGYMMEIEVADGTIAIVATCNPLKLDREERVLLFALVDMLNTFTGPSIGDEFGKELRDEDG